MLPTRYLPAMLLALCCVAAQALVPDAVPARSLEAEMSHAGEARTVPIHTAFASGEALFFADSGTVLAARHALMTPSNVFADKITIAVALPPLQNMEELSSTPIAQDPGHDLVLLRVANYTGARPVSAAAAPASAATAAVPPCGPAQTVPVAAAPGITTHTARRHARHRARASTHRRTPETHVVWDGPIAHWQ